MTFNIKNKINLRSIKEINHLSLKLVSVVIVLFMVIGGLGYWLWKVQKEDKNSSDNKTITAQKTETDASQTVAIDENKFKAFGVQINKIGVKAVVTANVNGDNKSEYNDSLKVGLAHFKGTELPGAGGNIFIFGHSSGGKEGGPYTKVFSKLNNLSNGDKIVVYYQGQIHDYTITEKKVVASTDLSPLNLTKDERLTLMTCWPIGTKEKRLIIIAKPV